MLGTKPSPALGTGSAPLGTRTGPLAQSVLCSVGACSVPIGTAPLGPGARYRPAWQRFRSVGIKSAPLGTSTASARHWLCSVRHSSAVFGTGFTQLSTHSDQSESARSAQHRLCSARHRLCSAQHKALFCWAPALLGTCLLGTGFARSARALLPWHGLVWLSTAGMLRVRLI